MESYTGTLDNILQRTFRLQYNGETSTCFTVDRYRKQYLVTARHVIPPTGRNIIVDIQHDGEWKRLDCKILARAQGDIDICILSPPHPIAPAATTESSTQGITLGQDVYFLGFPYGLQSEAGAFNEGFPFPLVKKACVSMRALTEKEGRYFLLDGVNNPGFSGGPVVFSPRNAPNSAYIAAVIAGYRFVWEKVYFNECETELAVRNNTGIIMAYSIEHALDLIRLNPGGAPIVESHSPLPALGR